MAALENPFHSILPDTPDGIWTQVNLEEKFKEHFGPDHVPVTLETMLELLQRVNEDYKCDYSHGGYREDRSLLTSDGGTPTNIITYRLGVDINDIPVGSTVTCPIDNATVYSVLFISPSVGTRLVLQFTEEGVAKYFIFGHLVCDVPLQLGSILNKGDVIGHIADYDKNGNTYTHLSVQGVYQKFIHMHSSDIEKLSEYYKTRDPSEMDSLVFDPYPYIFSE